MVSLLIYGLHDHEDLFTHTPPRSHRHALHPPTLGRASITFLLDRVHHLSPYVHTYIIQNQKAKKLEAQVAKLESAAASATAAASGKATKASKAEAKAAETKMRKEIEHAEAKSKVLHTYG